MEHRAEGGTLSIAQVAVPAVAEVMDVIGLLDDAEHVGVPVEGLDVGMPVECAESPRERRERARVERLVAEDQHQVLQQAGADAGDGVVIELARQVDAGHLGAK